MRDGVQLTVGVPAELLHRNPPDRGAGRVYHSVVPRLKELCRVDIAGETPGRLRRFRHRQPDVWIEGAHAGPIERPGPAVAICHGAEYLTHPEAFAAVDRAYAERVASQTKAAVESADLVITGSRHTRDSLVRGLGVPFERVRVVHHGVDTSSFRPGIPGGREIVAGCLGVSRPYILFVGAASTAKNLGKLRAAMHEVTQRGLPHALAVAGIERSDADVTDEMTSGADERVAWLGKVEPSTVAVLMAGADAVCHPSAMESFPLVVLEAMATGTPVVASNRGGIPEMVEDAGLLIEPEVPEIEQSILRVLTDRQLAESLARKGRERALHLTWEQTARGWFDVLRSAYDGRR